jgi:hypothetical protein
MTLHASADSGAASTGAQCSACGAMAAGVTGDGMSAACDCAPLRGRFTVGSSGRGAAGVGALFVLGGAMVVLGGAMVVLGGAMGALVAGTLTRLGVMVLFPFARG